jgi:hypothetical protein
LLVLGFELRASCLQSRALLLHASSPRPENFKLLYENIGKTLQHIGICNYFLNRTLIAQDIKARIDKWDCIKLKRKQFSRSRVNPQNGRKFCKLFIEQGTTSRIYKESKN